MSHPVLDEVDVSSALGAEGPLEELLVLGIQEEGRLERPPHQLGLATRTYLRVVGMREMLRLIRHSKASGS
jgi:hypothetical protein